MTSHKTRDDDVGVTLYRERRFSGSGSSDDADHLAAPDVAVDALHDEVEAVAVPG